MASDSSSAEPEPSAEELLSNLRSLLARKIDKLKDGDSMESGELRKIRGELSTLKSRVAETIPDSVEVAHKLKTTSTLLRQAAEDVSSHPDVKKALEAMRSLGKDSKTREEISTTIENIFLSKVNSEKGKKGISSVTNALEYLQNALSDVSISEEITSLKNGSEDSTSMIAKVGTKLNIKMSDVDEAREKLEKRGIRVKEDGIVKLIEEARSATNSPIALTKTSKVIDTSNALLKRVIESGVLQKNIPQKVISGVQNPNELLQFGEKIVVDKGARQKFVADVKDTCLDFLLAYLPSTTIPPIQGVKDGVDYAIQNLSLSEFKLNKEDVSVVVGTGDHVSKGASSSPSSCEM